jgi:isochorismate hydrolase
MKRHPNILDAQDAVLLIIDVQEAFRKFIPDIDKLAKNICTLMKAAAILKLPVLVTEQYPKGLGRTISEISSTVGDHQLFEKQCFSCCGSDEFASALASLSRKQVIVSGIEAHVCVNQTVHDLLLTGYKPHLVTDAVSSRLAQNKKIGLKKMIGSGAVPSTVEMCLFEMLINSGTESFKAVQQLVK